MGKATRWLKGLLGMKKEKDNNNNFESSSISSNNGRNKENKRWSFQRSGKPPAPATFPANIPNTEEEEGEWVVGSYYVSNYGVSKGGDRCNYAAIEVAAATAAAADAAVTAAHAAAAVVRLTGGRRREGGRREVHGAAAVMVQSVFRGYLARKALRALKGLVKIQALVRGYLVRKKAAATLYSMQALIRAQNAARSQRARRSMNKENRFLDEFRGRRSMENQHSEVKNGYYRKRLSPSYENSLSPFEESPKIVEIDTYKPRSRSRRMSTSVWEFSEDPYYQTISSPLPCPLTSRLSIPKTQKYENYECGYYDNEYKFSTAHSTPRFTKSYKYNGPPTPSKSVCGDSLFSLYSNHPSYMANTQSFNAKLRSQSAPRHRPELVSKKRMSLDEILASRNSLSGVKMQRSCSQVQQTLNI